MRKKRWELQRPHPQKLTITPRKFFSKISGNGSPGLTIPVDISKGRHRIDNLEEQTNIVDNDHAQNERRFPCSCPWMYECIQHCHTGNAALALCMGRERRCLHVSRAFGVRVFVQRPRPSAEYGVYRARCLHGCAGCAGGNFVIVLCDLGSCERVSVFVVHMRTESSVHVWCGIVRVEEERIPRTEPVSVQGDNHAVCL